MHFPQGFAIIAKHGKLVWLSRQSDSLVMNRSAVRIRPPAPQKPAQMSGFPRSLRADSNLSLTLSAACSTLLADQMRRFRYSVAQALLANPPTSSTETRSNERVSLFSVGVFLPFADASLPHEKIKDFPAGIPRRLLDFETTGDGVKQRYPLAGFGCANVQLGTYSSELNIFAPSPVVSELCENKRMLGEASSYSGTLYQAVRLGGARSECSACSGK